MTNDTTQPREQAAKNIDQLINDWFGSDRFTGLFNLERLREFATAYASIPVAAPEAPIGYANLETLDFVVGFYKDQVSEGYHAVYLHASTGAAPEAPASEHPALLSEILTLATQGMCHGLLADDYCSQIVAKIKGATSTSSAGGEPEGWRQFIKDCAEASGGMVNGNRLAMRAREVLDFATPAATTAPASEQEEFAHIQRLSQATTRSYTPIHQVWLARGNGGAAPEAPTSEQQAELRTIIERVRDGAKEWPGGWSGTIPQLEKALALLATPAATTASTCPTCKGNDRDAPCAYPSEGKPGCLRDARLAATTASASGEKCEHCNGTGWRIGSVPCPYCRAPAPSRNAAPVGPALRDFTRAVVEHLGWAINGTFVVTKSGDNLHTADAISFVHAALTQQSAALAATEKKEPRNG